MWGNIQSTVIFSTVQVEILSDEDVKVFLSSFGLRQPADLQLYSRERRREILREAKLYGASIRQLVRLTGISFYIVKEA